MAQDHTCVNLIFCMMNSLPSCTSWGLGGQHLSKVSLRTTNELWFLCVLEGRLLQCTNQGFLALVVVSHSSAHRVKAFCLGLEHGFQGLTRPGPELLHILGLPFMDPRHSDQEPGESFSLTIGSPPLLALSQAMVQGHLKVAAVPHAQNLPRELRR